jgi:hypothetical protein
MNVAGAADRQKKDVCHGLVFHVGHSRNAGHDGLPQAKTIVFELMLLRVENWAD